MIKYKISYCKYYLCSLFLFFVFTASGKTQAQENQAFDKNFRDRLASYRGEFPQIKTYVQTNKETYYAGESIWFKLYVTDAFSHTPDTLTSVINVDLVSATDRKVELARVKTDNGYGEGDIFLPDSLPSGSYILRAYNDYTLAHYPDFIFQKTIQVHNPEENNYISRREIRGNRRFNRDLEKKEEEFRVNFYPESGKLVSGLPGRVVIKATNELGKGVKVSGVINDQEGTFITDIEAPYPGIGDFHFVPRFGVVYFAVLNMPNGKSETYELPGIQKEGFVVSTDKQVDGILANIRKNFDALNAGFDADVFIVLHSGGEIHFTEKLMMSENQEDILIPGSFLSPGINVVSLLDENGLLLAERALFIYGSEFLQADIEIMELEKQDSLFLSVDINVAGLDGVEGNFALSVTDLPVAGEMPSQNIVTYFLLTSDFSYDIENPAFFLSSQENASLLDYHMIINGWDRYDFNKMIQNQEDDRFLSRYPGLTLRGQVQPKGSNMAVGKNLIEFQTNVDGELDLRRVHTDSKGRFVIDSLNYEGFFKVEITPGPDPRGRRLLVSLSDVKTPELRLNSEVEPLYPLERGNDWERTKRPEVYSETKEIRNLTDMQTIYSDADQVIYMDDLAQQYNSVFEVLRGRVSGMTFTGNEITIRGQGSVISGNEPIFLIDGVVVPKNNFLTMPINDIARIEILKGPQTAIFGSRGANGAIAAITREGNQQLTATFEFVVKGYSIPRDFLTALYLSDSSLSQYPEYVHTHYWEPNVILKSETEKRIIFPLFKETEGYLITLEGLDEKGRLLSKRLIIQGE